MYGIRSYYGLLNGSGNLILRRLGASHREGQPDFHTPAEIEILVKESHEGGLLDDEAQQMLRNAFRLRELPARQVMIPRTRLVAASIESAVDGLLRTACKEGYSRIRNNFV